jgi:hypothetical protein
MLTVYDGGALTEELSMSYYDGGTSKGCYRKKSGRVGLGGGGDGGFGRYIFW